MTRNRGTVGGSIAHADGAAELPVCLAALDGLVVVDGPDGRREIPADAFFVTHYLTTLRPGELVVETVWPLGAPDETSAFEELALRAGDFAQSMVAVVLRRDEGGAVTRASVTVGAVTDRPSRLVEVEALLVGSSGSEAARRGRGARGAARRPAGLGPRERPLPARAHRRPDDARDRAGVVIEIELTVNGRSVREAVEPRLLLTDFLRHRLGLTGTHVGCEHGVCGACTVLLDGVSVRGCCLLAVQADGSSVDTVESLAGPGPLTALQESFRRHHALQCGFCTPGILIAASDLLSRGRPTRAEIVDMLSGHLCRCTGYAPIVDAIEACVDSTQASPGRS